MSFDNSKTQTILLTEAVKELKESREKVEERLRLVEQTGAETKIYFKTIVEKLDEIKSMGNTSDTRITALETRSAETRGRLWGIASAASIGGGGIVAAFLEWFKK